MPPGPAHIDSPDVIRHVREEFIRFDKECRKELEGIRSDVGRVLNWLEGEQTSLWTAELRKREEAAHLAQRAFNDARYAVGPMKPQGYEEQRIALKHAMRRKEEAENKIKAIRKWTLAVSQEAMKDLKPCETLASWLTTLTPQVIQRLDRMLDSLDDYIHASPPPASGTGNKA